MKKRTVLWIILDFVFIAVFNVVFFMAGGTDHPASVWVSYAFIHVAYLLVVITPFLNRKGRDTALFGATLETVTTAYFAAAFVVGLIFILLRLDSIKLPLIIQIVLAGIYLLMLIPNMIANETTAQRTEEQMEALQYVKTCCVHLKALMGKVEDKSVKKKLERAYDVIHASPVKTTTGVARNYELLIVDMLDIVEKHIAQGNNDGAEKTLEEVIQKANERNNMI